MADIIDPFATEEEDNSIVDPFAQTDTDDQTTEAIPTETKDDISTQMYEGMTFEAAWDKYNQLMQSPDVTPPPFGIGYAVYTDPETKRSEYILQPTPRMFGKDGLFDNTADALMGVITLDKDRILSAYDDTQATTSTIDKIGTGMAESVGDIVELGAAGAEKLGAEGAVEAVKPYTPKIDTGDDFVDTLITDAIPAVAAAFTGAGAAATVTKNMPKVVRGLSVVLSAEAAAAGTTGTDEGTMFLGGEEAAVLPLAQGLDIGDSEADAVIEQRFNVLVEGMFLNSALAGVGIVGKEVVDLASKFTILPILDAARGSSIERRVYEQISDKLAGVGPDATPQQIAEAKREIANIIEQNKEVLIPQFENLVKEEVPVDTISALLRGVTDPVDVARIGGERAGQLQKGSAMAKTLAASETPAREMEANISSYLDRVSGESGEVGKMADAADELATEARTAVDNAGSAVGIAQVNYDNAAREVAEGLKNSDLELGGQISRLEDVTGTDIVTGQSGSFDQVRDGLVKAHTTMTDQKNALYDAIPEGTAFDVEGFGKALVEATQDANAFDDAGKQLLSKRLVATLRRAYNKTTPVQGTDAFGVPTEGVENVPMEQIVQEILDSGADFKVLYNQIRPALADLADEAYSSGNREVGKRLAKLRSAIDEQVTWIAANGDGDAATAAKEAADYYSNTYAPIWRDGGKMQEFGELHDPVLSRGTQRSGFVEDSRDLVTNVLSGSNADAVANMKTALAQVTDPKPIADYMIADVINSFASDVRSKGMSAEAIQGMSQRLQQYAVSLNEAFPDRAGQINSLIKSIENAAGNQRLLDMALKQAEEVANETQNAVRKSELGRFLSSVYGREMETTVNPEAAFVKIFREAEGLGTVQDIMTRVKDLPEARGKVVQEGLEVAYLRFLQDRITGAKVQSGGASTLKGGATDRILDEANNVLSLGRQVFADKPEFMQGIETLLEASRMIEKQKQSQPIAGVSPTQFYQEASKATNRMIMTLIGPLSRTGARVRALAGAGFDALDPTKKAQTILDNILSDPEEYVRLARKYDSNPMDPQLQEQIITALIAGGTKGVNAEVEYMYDQNNQDQQMMEMMNLSP